MEILVEYAQKCRILRQIQSNKARTYAQINTAQNIATVTFASFLTFIGFSGIDKITVYANWFGTVDKSAVELAFNLQVFLLFVLAIFHLVFQFGKKQSDSERAVVNRVRRCLDKSHAMRSRKAEVRNSNTSDTTEHRSRIFAR